MIDDRDGNDVAHGRAVFLILLGIAHGVGYGGMDDRVFMFLQSISYINNYKKQL